jgi:hypothetical protein
VVTGWSRKSGVEYLMDTLITSAILLIYVALLITSFLKKGDDE